MMRVTRTPTWFKNDDLIIMMIIPIKMIYFDYFYYCIVFNYYHYTVDYIIIVILSILWILCVHLKKKNEVTQVTINASTIRHKNRSFTNEYKNKKAQTKSRKLWILFQQNLINQYWNVVKQIYIITHAETCERKVQSEFFFETINHFNLNMVILLIFRLGTGYSVL